MAKPSVTKGLSNTSQPEEGGDDSVAPLSIPVAGSSKVVRLRQKVSQHPIRDDLKKKSAHTQEVDQWWLKDGLKIDWDKSTGGSAYAFFTDVFSHIPYEKRPTADQVRQASRRFYNALAQRQLRNGETIGDLFPIDPNARGGAKAKGGGDLTLEGLLARLERTRESARKRMAKLRAGKRATP